MNVALIIVIVYMLLLLFVAWASAMFRRNSSAEAFLLANKQLSWPLVGVMIAGIAVGGSSTVGIAQNAYTSGISAGWYDVAWAAGAIIVGFALASHIRNSEYVTINKMLGSVFGGKFSIVSTVIQVMINTVIIALQIIAGGAILTALMPEVFTMSLGIIVSAVMFGLISFVGGLTAASVSNVVNIAVIYIGLTVGLIATVSHFGGFATINASLPVGMSGDGSHWYSMVKGMGLAAIVAWFVTMIVDAVPNGGVIQNIIAARSPADAKKGTIFAGILMIPAGFMSAIFGIVAAAYFPGLESSAMALPAVVMELPSWVAGILLAGLWAADVSTATGLMMGVSTMVSEDVVFKYFYKGVSRKLRLRISRIVCLAVIIIAYLGATQVSNILSALMSALTLFGPYAILMTAIFLFPRAVKRSTGWLTLIFGLVSFVVVQFFVPEWRILGQSIYTVMLMSFIGFGLSQIDKNQASVDHLRKTNKEQ
ncbi:MAG: sodium:solute symporter family protein [Peptococcaceae bacterium]|nr:sodium:solute symporter family protein [Peptococcaceae bacterium]